MKIRLPDTISVLTENNERITVGPCEKAGGICVSTSLEESGDVLSAHINAPSVPLCFVEFTWKLTENEQRNDDVKVYGDAWERGYGDLEWRKPENTGMMPWFFMLSNGSDSNRDFSGRKTSCFGVKVPREHSAHGDTLNCNTIGHLCAGLVEIDRTGDDTSGQEWERTRKMGINTLAFRMMQHNAFFASDADCVGLTASVPWELNSRWLNILSISGTPLFVSWDRYFTSDEIESAVRTALVRNSRSNDTLVPIDRMEKITPEEWLLNGEKIVFKWE